jgi:single-strand DNA-binding protein
MAGSLNKVILIGNLGKDPDIRFMPDGSRVTSFSLATSDVWKDKVTGERRDKTEWHRISIFNERLIEVVEKYVRKGMKLYIEGQLQSKKWTDQAGNERITTDVVLGKFRGELVILDPKKNGESDSEMRNDAAPNDIPLDDELPF